jgi:hypothetical protein
VSRSPHNQAEEHPDCDWAAAKSKVRSQIPETAFINWFAPTRQEEHRGAVLTVVVPDEPTRSLLLPEYDHITKGALQVSAFGEFRYVVQDTRPNQNEPARVDSSQRGRK